MPAALWCLSFRRHTSAQPGFTLIEVVLVVGITAALFTIMSISLSTLFPRTTTRSALTALVADLRQQQLLAMVGATSGGATLPHGIYLEENQYTLFSGEAFATAAPESIYTVILDVPLRLAHTANSAEIVFSPGSGVIAGSDGTPITVTIYNPDTNSTLSAQLNSHGIVTETN